MAFNSCVAVTTPAPLAMTIPASQWSGSGSDYYVTVNASNITADSILIPHYDEASAAYLNGLIWCVPAAGSFTIHTSAIPSGAVTVLIQFAGTNGDAQYQVLADVYSTSQALAKADVVDELTSTATNVPLSANQGKVLNEAKVNYSDIVNNLTSTATDAPLSAAQGRALNNVKADRYKYNGAICSASATSSGDVFSYFTDPPVASYLCVLFRHGFAWEDAASVYFIEHGVTLSVYGKTVIKEGSSSNCPKLDANGHIYLPATTDNTISIFIMRLN